MLICLLAGLSWVVPVSSYSQEYKIGVLANRGAMQAFKEWQSTADYLSNKTGKKFSVIPLEYDQLLHQMGAPNRERNCVISIIVKAY
ncbi:exported hypothetical protein [Syntrophobacter sp. SbD1]|nr:exported hypothetical protein [Syntrophobacter sp. SbD1]